MANQLIVENPTTHPTTHPTTKKLKRNFYLEKIISLIQKAL